jgi:excisionase family DNA binding protein
MATVSLPPSERKRSTGQIPLQALHQRRQPVMGAVVSVDRSDGVPLGVAELSKGLGEAWATGVPAGGVVAQGRRPALSPGPALSTDFAAAAIAPRPAVATSLKRVAVDARGATAVVPLGPLPVTPRRRTPAPRLPRLPGGNLLPAGAPLFYLVHAPFPSLPSVAAEHSTGLPAASRGGEAPKAKASPLLLTVQEVAAALRCGRTCVYELVGRGELPVIKLGRLTRIPAAALEAFVSRRIEDRAAVDPNVARWAASLPRPVGAIR